MNHIPIYRSYIGEYPPPPRGGIVHVRELILSQLVNLAGNDLKLTRSAFEIAAIPREQKAVLEPVRHTVEVY